MKVHRFSQQQRFIAISLMLALACAIPLLVANPDDDSYSDPGGQWEAWAWAKNSGGHEVGNMTISESSHQHSIWNKTNDELSFDLDYHHVVTKENVGGIWENQSSLDDVDVPAQTYYTSSRSGRSGDWTTVEGNFTLSVYSAVCRNGLGPRTSDLNVDFSTD